MRQVVWGWRRSTPDEESSRLVYFAAYCNYLDESAELTESRLVIDRRGSQIECLQRQAMSVKGARVEISQGGFSVSIGCITEEDRQRIGRLNRTRRHSVRDLSHFHETSRWASRLTELRRTRPHLVVLVGSGLSYEAGIPTLASMHKLFGVDNGPGSDFCLTDTDPLLDALCTRTYSDFQNEVQAFHSACACAQLSQSHEFLQKAYRDGQISMMLTDNVDDIFERRLSIPVSPTRGDGLTSERYSELDSLCKMVQSASHVLLVLGVSADRRGIIETLAPLIPTIVVNPALPVSPHSKNLDYLEELGFNEEGESKYGHVFIKRQAQQCLGEVISLLCG